MTDPRVYKLVVKDESPTGRSKPLCSQACQGHLWMVELSSSLFSASAIRLILLMYPL